MSQLNSTFQGDFKPAPGTHDGENAGPKYESPKLNTPDDVSVLGEAPFAKLSGSPAALDTPMGTAIPNVGKGFKS